MGTNIFKGKPTTSYFNSILRKYGMKMHKYVFQFEDNETIEYSEADFDDSKFIIILDNTQAPIVLDNVITVDNSTFNGIDKSSIVEIRYSTNVTTIRSNAFEGCTNLKVLHAPIETNLTHIDEGTFLHTTALMKAVLPMGEISLEANAFKNCPAGFQLSEAKPSNMPSMKKVLIILGYDEEYASAFGDDPIELDLNDPSQSSSSMLKAASNGGREYRTDWEVAYPGGGRKPVKCKRKPYPQSGYENHDYQEGKKSEKLPINDEYKEYPSGLKCHIETKLARMYCTKCGDSYVCVFTRRTWTFPPKP